MNKITAEKVKKHLKTKIFGREVIVLDETLSTNNDAKNLAESGAKEGIAVIARCQSKGRGRMGRSFFSQKDTGLYMSVVLKEEKALKSGILLTSLAAVAVARAIERVCCAHAKIKWVNDIYINGKKVCGILTEGKIDAQNGVPQYIVLGIGINVKKTQFPKDIAKIATSLENETGEEISVNLLAAEVLNELEMLYQNFETGDFLKENKARSTVIGKKIKVVRGNESYDAFAKDIDNCGGLIIIRDGKEEVLSSGEVSVRTLNED